MKIRIIERMTGLHWDLTPQISANALGCSVYTVNSQEDLDGDNKKFAKYTGYYFFVNVAACIVELCLMHNHQNGQGEIIHVTFDDTELLEECVNSRGSITNSGLYPITEKLEAELKLQLGLAGAPCSN